MEGIEGVRWNGAEMQGMVRLIEKPYKRETEMGANGLKVSKCGPWTSSSSVTWDCVRHANSWSHPTPSEPETRSWAHWSAFLKAL